MVLCKSGLRYLTKPRVLLTRSSHMTQLFLKCIQGDSDDAHICAASIHLWKKCSTPVPLSNLYIRIGISRKPTHFSLLRKNNKLGQKHSKWSA